MDGPDGDGGGGERPAGRSFRRLAGVQIEALDGVGGEGLEAAAKRRGEERAAALHTLGVHTVLDLVQHWPRRHIDRTTERAITDLVPGEQAMVLGEVDRAEVKRLRGGRTMVVVDIRGPGDGRGRLRCTFFNQPWRAKQLAGGMRVVVFGKPEVYAGRLQMTNPVVDLVGDRTGRIVPVYPQSEKIPLTTWEVGGLVEQALGRAGAFADPLPPEVLVRHGLVDRTAAIRGYHLPDSMGEVSSARKRLVFDELLRMQVALVARKRAIEATSSGFEHRTGGPLVDAFLAGLPFELTASQRQVLDVIAVDLAAPLPMHRLLQGEVGSGKTVVAVAALLTAVEGGHQGAFMAPTEVLAEQHHRGITALLDGLVLPDAANLFGARQLTVRLLTSRTTAAERRALVAGLASGEVDLVIGTHALLEEAVAFRSLGVVVIDEQHRFGVEQRSALRDKGELAPDVLVMTATPIPRTAAMTVYGDLDVSEIRELPGGRKPITTTWVQEAPGEAEAWDAVREQVAAGHQAYVVCPLVEGSDKLEVASATETFEALGKGALAGLRLGLLHGRVPAAEKEPVFAAFRGGDLDVLVATTVIEVGVDVPNATVMVVLDADRFGMAQLHQLRGRIGRGGFASTCFLVTRPAEPGEVEVLLEDGPVSEAQKRLEALVASTDGFELAEIDLDLRGEGTLMDARQKGRNDLRLASLRRDRRWVEVAREVAFALVDGPGGLTAHPLLADEVDLLLGGDEGTPDADRTAFLLKS